MRRVTFYVLRVGEQWTVSSSQRGLHDSSHADRHAARRAAEAAALALWQEQRIATQVSLSEDDGVWHPVAEFGELVDLS